MPYALTTWTNSTSGGYHYYNHTWSSSSNMLDAAVVVARVQARRQADALDSHDEAAKRRALELLERFLTREQAADFARLGFFETRGGRSGRLYRIYTSRDLVANIVAMNDNDEPTHRLCAHAGAEAVPLGDHLLSQKLMIEYAEDDFLRVANKHGL